MWGDVSGDCVHAPDEGGVLSTDEIIRRVSTAFRRVVIDREEGDGHVERRIGMSEQVYRGFLLEAEYALRGTCVAVAVNDGGQPWLRFLLWPDNGAIDLAYDPPGDDRCVAAARKLADVLGYEYQLWDGDAAT